MRIAQYIARCGLCSRRQAETLIEQGIVFVNEKNIKNLAYIVQPNDIVRVNNQICKKDVLRIWKYYKPIKRITTRHDPQGRKTIYQDFPLNIPHIMPIGRLDFMSEGLLILTNDGYFARYMEHPRYSLPRTYRVWTEGRPSKKALDFIQKPFIISNIQYQPMHIQEEKNSFLITITEGKNRQIRKVMSYIQCPVTRLLRITHGPFSLTDLNPKEIKEIKQENIPRFFLDEM